VSPYPFFPFALSLPTFILVAICSSLAPLDKNELTIRATLTKVDHSGRKLYGHNGGVWEWTTTPLAGYPGYVPSELYPGYSADFFDDKHYVVVCSFAFFIIIFSFVPFFPISVNNKNEVRRRSKRNRRYGRTVICEPRL
jgi:hypothetical protein